MHQSEARAEGSGRGGGRQVYAPVWVIDSMRFQPSVAAADDDDVVVRLDGDGNMMSMKTSLSMRTMTMMSMMTMTTMSMMTMTMTTTSMLTMTTMSMMTTLSMMTMTTIWFCFGLYA